MHPNNWIRRYPTHSVHHLAFLPMFHSSTQTNSSLCLKMGRVKIEDTNIGSAFASLFLFNHKVVSDKTSQQIRLVYELFSQTIA